MQTTGMTLKNAMTARVSAALSSAFGKHELHDCLNSRSRCVLAAWIRQNGRKRSNSSRPPARRVQAQRGALTAASAGAQSRSSAARETAVTGIQELIVDEQLPFPSRSTNRDSFQISPMQRKTLAEKGGATPRVGRVGRSLAADDLF